MLLPPRTTAACLKIALVLASPLSAFADSGALQRYLTAAERLYENLEYERALEQLGRAKSLPRELNDDVAIALYEGIILADMGKKDESSAAFRTALLLNPEATLPVKVSPKVEQDFEQLRLRVRKELAPILAKQEAERRKQATRPEQPKAVRPPLRPAYEPDASLARSSDAFSFQSALPYGLLGATAVAGGVGAIFGIQSRNQVSAARGAASEDAAQSHLHSANTDATIANLLFATAGTAAVGTVITYLLGANPAPARTAK